MESVEIQRCKAKRMMIHSQCLFCGKNEEAIPVPAKKRLFRGVCIGFKEVK